MLAAIGLALSVGSQLFGSVAGMRAAGANRRFARQQARDVLDRGEEDVVAYRRDLAQLLGAQRLGAAAQGIDVNQGSAAQIRQQTETFGEQDVEMIRENARRQAWGIRTQANLDYRAGINRGIAGIGGAIGEGILGGKRLYDQAQAAKRAEEARTLLMQDADPWTSYAGQTLRRNPRVLLNMARAGARGGL